MLLPLGVAHPSRCLRRVGVPRLPMVLLLGVAHPSRCLRRVGLFGPAVRPRLVSRLVDSRFSTHTGSMRINPSSLPSYHAYELHSQFLGELANPRFTGFMCM